MQARWQKIRRSILGPALLNPFFPETLRRGPADLPDPPAGPVSASFSKLQEPAGKKSAGIARFFQRIASGADPYICRSPARRKTGGTSARRRAAVPRVKTSEFAEDALTYRR